MEIRKTQRRPTIKSFQDLEVYQRLYELMLIVLKEIAPRLPDKEKYDLKDQMRRASKSCPALLAEGFAKRYQPRSWKKYLEDTTGECNEMIHHLSVCRDVYAEYVNEKLCKKLIDEYDISCKQLSNLRKSWKNFHENK